MIFRFTEFDLSFPISTERRKTQTKYIRKAGYNKGRYFKYVSKILYSNTMGMKALRV